MKKLKLVGKSIVDQPEFSLKGVEIIKCIGSGGFSKVLLGRVYGVMMAIKVIDKELILRNGKESIIVN